MACGETALNTPTTCDFTVENGGYADLEIDFYSINGKNKDDFSVLSPDFPVTIAEEGMAQSVTVQCQPTESGLREATLNLNTTDTSKPSVSYDLACTGIASVTPIYSLFITSEGSGTVINTPEGSDCGNDCIEYPENTQVKLKGIPDENWQFEQWGGDCSQNGEIIMTDNQACRAVFTPTPDELMTPITTGTSTGTIITLPSELMTVTTTGTGKGTIISMPSGLNCGADCTEQFSPDTLVTLSAKPDINSQFEGWEGDCDEKGTVTMNREQSCTAIFNRKPVLTIITEGKGQILLNDYLDCGQNCTQMLPKGTPVTLIAEPDEGWIFDKWSEGCGNNLLINNDLKCTAFFLLKPFYYTLAIQIYGEGRIMDCREDCLKEYEQGSEVTLIAKPDVGYRTIWGGDCEPLGINNTIIMTEHRSCTVHFQPILSVRIEGEGSVTSEPSGIDCRYSCEHSFSQNTPVILTVKPKPYWVFDHWLEDCDKEGKVGMYKGRTCTAVLLSDKDGDSIPDQIEKGAPFKGDGNDDGILDSQQNRVASLLDKNRGNYITIEIGETECAIEQIQTTLTDMSAPTNISMVNLELNEACKESDVMIFYHGDQNSFFKAYREFGAQATHFLDSQGWYSPSGILPQTVNIQEQAVTKVPLKLLTKNHEIVSTDPKKRSHVKFLSPNYHVDENSETADIILIRQESRVDEVCIDYAALDHTAKMGEDYRLEQGTLCWADGETGEKTFSIEIIDNDVQEETNKLLLLSLLSRHDVEIETGIANVIIVNDDLPSCASNQEGVFRGVCTLEGEKITGTLNPETRTREITIVQYNRLDEAVFEDQTTIETGARVNDATFEKKVSNNGMITQAKDFQGEVINKDYGDIKGTDSSSKAIFKSEVSNYGRIDYAEFHGNVQNTQGSIKNATIHSGARIIGGDLSGHIHNQGTLINPQFSGELLEGGTLEGLVINNQGGIIRDVHIISDTHSAPHIDGGKLEGKITGEIDNPAILQNVEVLPNSHLSNVIIDGAVILPKNVTLENVQLGANIHIKGGELRGKITSEEAQAPAQLENVNIKAGSTLENVIIGENVRVEANSTLENVIIAGQVRLGTDITLKNIDISTDSNFDNVILSESVTIADEVTLTLNNIDFTANTHIQGGKLQGQIKGDSENPVFLENVEILPNSHVENVVFKNVKWGKGVRKGVGVIYCVDALAIDTYDESAEIDTETCLTHQLLTTSGTQNDQTTRFSYRESKSVTLSVTFYIDSEDVEKEADIFIAVQHDNLIKETWYTLNQQTWREWDEDLNSLSPAIASDEPLLRKVKVPIYEGNLNQDMANNLGEFTVYVAYRLKDGTLIYNGIEAITLFFGNAVRVDKTQDAPKIITQHNNTSFFAPWVESDNLQASEFPLKTLSFADSEIVNVKTRLNVDSADVGKSAKIYRVVVHNHFGEIKAYPRYLDVWPIWAGVDSLEPVGYYDKLDKIVEIPVYQGDFRDLPGTFTVYVGYSVDDDVIIFNGIAPIVFQINNSRQME